jgi:hypothetical protein
MFSVADAYAKYLQWNEDGTIMLIDKDFCVRYLFWHIDASKLSNRIGELLAESG